MNRPYWSAGYYYPPIIYTSPPANCLAVITLALGLFSMLLICSGIGLIILVHKIAGTVFMVSINFICVILGAISKLFGNKTCIPTAGLIFSASSLFIVALSKILLVLIL